MRRHSCMYIFHSACFFCIRRWFNHKSNRRKRAKLTFGLVSWCSVWKKYMAFVCLPTDLPRGVCVALVVISKKLCLSRSSEVLSRIKLIFSLRLNEHLPSRLLLQLWQIQLDLWLLLLRIRDVVEAEPLEVLQLALSVVHVTVQVDVARIEYIRWKRYEVSFKK